MIKYLESQKNATETGLNFICDRNMKWCFKNIKHRLGQISSLSLASARRSGPPVVSGQHSQVKITGLINNTGNVRPTYVCNCPMIDFCMEAFFADSTWLRAQRCCLSCTWQQTQCRRCLIFYARTSGCGFEPKGDSFNRHLRRLKPFTPRILQRKGRVSSLFTILM